MIPFVMRNHNRVYDTQTMIQVFYPNETYASVTDVPERGLCVESLLCADCAEAVLWRDGVRVRSVVEPFGGREARWAAKRAVYALLCAETGLRPAWGMTTGVRPAKLAREKLDAGVADAAILAAMTEEYLMQADKAQLALAVAHAEWEILRTNNGADCALYIGIPFCPTRCAYCSFAATTLTAKTDVDGYLDALEKELDLRAAQMAGRRLESVYIGGGTPTALDERQLARLLGFVRGRFAFDAVKEFTVEAGRPDTITAEKLGIMKAYGVSRISVNPQTLHDDTLAIIGRRHTAKQFFTAYERAVCAGFENINIDLIAGLPGEDARHMAATFDGIAALRPNAVTVHTLAVKRASVLKETLAAQRLTPPDVVEDMLRVTRERCAVMNLRPYYMYRQKNMLGNFENVGYARTGFEGVYNVQMMEENQTVFAAGAGAVGKRFTPSENRIERLPNCKDYRDYIKRMGAEV